MINQTTKYTKHLNVLLIFAFGAANAAFDNGNTTASTLFKPVLGDRIVIQVISSSNPDHNDLDPNRYCLAPDHRREYMMQIRELKYLEPGTIINAETAGFLAYIASILVLAQITTDPNPLEVIKRQQYRGGTMLKKENEIFQEYAQKFTRHEINRLSKLERREIQKALTLEIQAERFIVSGQLYVNNLSLKEKIAELTILLLMLKEFGQDGVQIIAKEYGLNGEIMRIPEYMQITYKPDLNDPKIFNIEMSFILPIHAM